MAVEIAVAVGVGRTAALSGQRLLLVGQEVPVRVDREGIGAGLHLVVVAEVVTIGVAAGSTGSAPAASSSTSLAPSPSASPFGSSGSKPNPTSLSVGHPVTVRVRVVRVGAGAIAAEHVGGLLARFHRVGQAVTVALGLGEQIVDALEPFLEPQAGSSRRWKGAA